MKKNRNWRKYAFEFLSIFVAVISAFALNNWNDNRKQHEAESKILTEISNGLEKDKYDIELNVFGHKEGINSCQFWREIFLGETPDTKFIAHHYIALTRDFLSIQNTSGYETLKSKGFELISNDSLRTKIISLYEYEYQTLRKLEEEFHEVQFQNNYFHLINEVTAPHFVYDSSGVLVDMVLPLQLEEGKKNVLLSYLYKIEMNRGFMLQIYNQVDDKIDQLMTEITAELDN